MRRGRKLLNPKRELKLIQVDGKSLTGSSWPCGGLLKKQSEERKNKRLVEAKRLLR